MAMTGMVMQSGKRAIIHAAAGGVGLASVEYVNWMGGAVFGTAGALLKHFQLRDVQPAWLCSSRDGTAFARGASGLLASRRAHGVFNSLSLDFISASVAMLGEGSQFAEIGKRAVWSSERYEAASGSGSQHHDRLRHRKR